MAVEWRLETLPLASLTAWHKNPRQLTQAQYDQLQTSMDTFGLIEKPIVNADAENTVIGGHQRLRILYDQGVREVECWVPERALSVREVEECNIRLNKNLGAFDWDILANEFEIEDLLDWGFSEIELQLDTIATNAATSSDSPSETAAASQYYALIVQCETLAARDALRSRLVAEGYICGIVDEEGAAALNDAKDATTTGEYDFELLDF